MHVQRVLMKMNGTVVFLGNYPSVTLTRMFLDLWLEIFGLGSLEPIALPDGIFGSNLISAGGTTGREPGEPRANKDPTAYLLLV